jgi:hypothetical protein
MTTSRWNAKFAMKEITPNWSQLSVITFSFKYT